MQSGDIGDVARQWWDDGATNDGGGDDTRALGGATPKAFAGQTEDRWEHDRVRQSNREKCITRSSPAMRTS